MFDIEAQCLDLAEHTKMICSQLASNFRTSPPGADAVMKDDSLVSGEQLKPLYQLIGSLLCLVDDKVHMQQIAGTTRVGYVHMYNHILEDKNAYADFSSSRAHKEFWTQ